LKKSYLKISLWCQEQVVVVVTTWAEIKTECEAGGKEVVLSDSFVPGDYPGQIVSGDGCKVRGAGQVLDADLAGRHFQVQGYTGIEIHGLTLKNGRGEGGAINVGGGARIKLTQIIFEDNIANYAHSIEEQAAVEYNKGGAIFAGSTGNPILDESGNPNFEISDSQFKSNSGYEVRCAATVSLHEQFLDNLSTFREGPFTQEALLFS
jgi:hypothetical protein